MSARFQAKAMVHPVLRCPLLKAEKKKKKKEREKEKPIRTCKPGYLEDHYPAPLHWFGSHKTILTGFTKFKQFAYYVPWL